MKRRIELRQLAYFVAVAEELSFRRAADRLAITQPPLTRQIQALEEWVGSALFERNHAGVALTPVGVILLAESRQLLHSADGLLDRLPRATSKTSRLRIGITTVVDASLFTWLEPALRETVPNLDLNQKRQISQRSIADVRKGSLDLAIIGLPCEAAGLTVERLTDDRLVAAIPAKHTLARRRRLSLHELDGDPFFWFARQLNPAYYDHFEEIFRKLGFSPTRLPEPTDHHVLLGLIAAGQGVALIPKSLTSIARTGVIYKELANADSLSMGIAVAYRPERQGSASLALLGKLREHFGVTAERKVVPAGR
ncbi:MAG: LysR family transcriptional regulator [Pseudomonadota bacterium]|nr:LysR family transcriptional regulator [Pseudomonadota bacterium]